MPRLSIALLLLTATVGFGVAPANAEEPSPSPAPPAEVDAARQNERHAIPPGTESLWSDMLAKGETLPGGCTLTDGKIERTAVLATYTCGDAPVVLQLLHPDAAPSGAVRTERFAVAVQSGTPPAGFVEAVAGKVRAREGAFQWTDVGGDGAVPASATRRPWMVLLAGGAAAGLVFWALRRRTSGTREG